MTIFEQLQAFTPFNEQEASDRRLMLQYAGLFSDLLTRDNEMAHLTASCWIVNPDKTKVLLAYHNIYDSWAWLGGHADGEADLLAVALKEANEESGVTARPVLRDIFSVEILGVPGQDVYKRQDLYDVDADDIALAVALALDLLGGSEHCVGAVVGVAAETDGHVAGVGRDAKHRAGENLMLFGRERVEDHAALCLADALNDDLLGGCLLYTS